jgi:hypothetical protein
MNVSAFMVPVLLNDICVTFTLILILIPILSDGGCNNVKKRKYSWNQEWRNYRTIWRAKCMKKIIIVEIIWLEAPLNEENNNNNEIIMTLMSIMKHQ